MTNKGLKVTNWSKLAKKLVKNKQVGLKWPSWSWMTQLVMNDPVGHEWPTWSESVESVGTPPQSRALQTIPDLRESHTTFWSNTYSYHGIYSGITHDQLGHLRPTCLFLTSFVQFLLILIRWSLFTSCWSVFGHFLFWNCIFFFLTI